MKIIFLGTGTSQGVPIIGCSCSICKSDNYKNKRLRTSLYVLEKNNALVIDAGPDFRQQMLQNSITNVDSILLTHEHKDHIAGLDDIRPFNFMKNKAMDIYAEPRVIKEVKREFEYVFKEDAYPGVPMMNIIEISENDFEALQVPITPLRAFHWKLPVLGYKIGKMAYITDASEIPQETINKIKNIDVFIINALRIEKHYSHFNLEEALEVIALVNPKKAYLTHISHLLGDVDEVEKTLPANVFLAYDGLLLEI